MTARAASGVQSSRFRVRNKLPPICSVSAAISTSGGCLLHNPGSRCPSLGIAALDLVPIEALGHHQQSPFSREGSRLMTIYLKRVAYHHACDARVLRRPMRKSLADLLRARINPGTLDIFLGEAGLRGFHSRQEAALAPGRVGVHGFGVELISVTVALLGIVAHIVIEVASVSVQAEVGGDDGSEDTPGGALVPGGLTTTAGRHGATVVITATPSVPILRNTPASISARATPS